MIEPARVAARVPACWVLSVALGAGVACEAPHASEPSSVTRVLSLRGRNGGGFEASSPSASLAPGAPGLPSVWAPARKSFLGTAASDASRVYFTGHRGAVSEVFYPQPDTVQTVALEFLVGDDAQTFVDAESAVAYTAQRPEPRSLRWRVTSEHAAHGWRLIKDVFTDPGRATIRRSATRARAMRR
jgi:glucoamylase